MNGLTITNVAPTPTNATRFHLSAGDALSYLRQMTSRTLDLMVTDWPYESLEKHRAVGTTTRLKHSDASSNDWFEIFPNARVAELLEEARRVLKKDAHLYFFADLETARFLSDLGEKQGLRLRNWITWDKQALGMGYSYRRCKEYVVYFEQGRRRLNDLGVGDHLAIPMSEDERGVDDIRAKRLRGAWPTEKPPFVAETIIRQSSNKGEVVCDPFMGSGSTGVAALTQGRHFLGNDLNPKSIEHARPRLLATGALEHGGR